MTHFDETSGIVACDTTWGRWWQTMEEVTIEVNLPEGISSKQIQVAIKPKTVNIKVHGDTIIQGEFTNVIKADEMVWTVEDKKLLRVCLPKVHTTADKCWKSLLKDQYEADPFIFDQMQKKLTLQRYQFENPGMDFSGAEITGNYHGGGPQLPDS